MSALRGKPPGRLGVLVAVALLTVGAVAHAAPAIPGLAADAGPPGADAGIPSMPADADPNAPTVLLRPGRTKVAIGEPFSLRISVLHRPDMQIELPISLPLDGDKWAEIGERKRGSERDAQGLVTTTFDLTVAALEEGTQTFPQLPVGYAFAHEHRQVLSPAQQITVTATIKDADADKTELKPAAAPVDVMVRDWTLLWVIGGVVVTAGLLLLGMFLGRRWKKRRRGSSAAASEAAINPADAALQRLRGLLDSPLLDGDRHAVYGELSDAVRQFLEARTGLGATAATTAELVEGLGPRISPDLAAGLIRLLEEADLVKFARADSTREEAVAAIHNAIAHCERLYAPPVALATPPAAEAAP